MGHAFTESVVEDAALAWLVSIPALPAEALEDAFRKMRKESSLQLSGEDMSDRPIRKLAISRG